MKRLLEELNSRRQERAMLRRLPDELIDLGFALVGRTKRSAAREVIPRALLRAGQGFPLLGPRWTGSASGKDGPSRADSVLT
jgi:hypothetical protein